MLTYKKKLRIGYCLVCFLVCIYVFEIKTAANVMFMNIRHLGDTLFASLHNNQPNLKSGKKSHKYLLLPWRGHEEGGTLVIMRDNSSATQDPGSDLMSLEASGEHRTVTPDLDWGYDQPAKN